MGVKRQCYCAGYILRIFSVLNPDGMEPRTWDTDNQRKGLAVFPEVGLLVCLGRYGVPTDIPRFGVKAIKYSAKARKNQGLIGETIEKNGQG